MAIGPWLRTVDYSPFLMILAAGSPPPTTAGLSISSPCCWRASPPSVIAKKSPNRWPTHELAAQAPPLLLLRLHLLTCWPPPPSHTSPLPSSPMDATSMASPYPSMPEPPMAFISPSLLAKLLASFFLSKIRSRALPASELLLPPSLQVIERHPPFLQATGTPTPPWLPAIPSSSPAFTGTHPTMPPVSIIAAHRRARCHTYAQAIGMLACYLAIFSIAAGTLIPISPCRRIFPPPSLHANPRCFLH